MQRFTRLFLELDRTNKTNEKVAALRRYLAEAEDADKLWAVALLSGRRPRRPVNSRLTREWAAEHAGVPDWLFQESYSVVGDLAETVALLLPQPERRESPSLAELMAELHEVREQDEEGKYRFVLDKWDGFDQNERFVFNKLVGGSFRVGVSQKLIVRALAAHTEQDEAVVAHRLMGDWTPDSTTFEDLLMAEESAEDRRSRPYPFYLAYPLEDAPDSLGAPADWIAERKWDGIRGQVIVRKGELFVWSRGEELITDKFPEFAPFAEALPDGTVLDGEILPYKDGQPLAFNDLQTRIGRKNVTKKILESAPVVLMAYDLLEWQGRDVRTTPFEQRREALEKFVGETAHERLLLSPTVGFDSWEGLAQEREDSRLYRSEGIMLKRRASEYKVGRKRGDWWKWKVDPLTIDAVLIYAQSGHGRRANLFTDYTFAVWDGERLVPFTKAYSGLTDEELKKVDAFVKRNTVERFGPVRSVTPELVFEIGFEGINESKRHKSGVALRFPRILRWRHDKKKEEADTLATLHGLLELQ